MKTGFIFVLFCFLALSVGSAFTESLTYDEVFYLEESQRILASQSFSDPYNPPLTPFLFSIPKAFGLKFPIASRLVTIGLGTLLILAVYQMGVRELGTTGGLVAALLVAFDPTVLAHSHYATNDIALTLFIFLAVMISGRFFVRPRLSLTIRLGIAIGFSIATKMTAIPFLLLSFTAMWWRHRQGRGWRWFVKQRMRFVLAIVITLTVLWSTYLFTWDVIIREREDPGRVSVRLVTYAKTHNLPALETMVTFFSKQPMPLGTYLATVKNNVLRIGQPALIFFDGTMFERSRWYFMIVNVLRKIPIPLLLLVIIGGRKSSWRVAVVIALGILFVSAFTGMVPLVRYVLPMIPFLALAGAAALTSLKLRGTKERMVIVVLLLWYVVGTIAQYPHFISYANAFAGPREKRYEVFADSNLDWGQALPDLARYGETQKIGKMRFSYFGRDDAALYGMPSATPYGSFRFEEICAFHDVVIHPNISQTLTVIGVSNWYYCGYYKDEAYKKENIRDVVADVFLVFNK